MKLIVLELVKLETNDERRTEKMYKMAKLENGGI